jgi:hypothetical protein
MPQKNPGELPVIFPALPLLALPAWTICARHWRGASI